MLTAFCFSPKNLSQEERKAEVKTEVLRAQRVVGGDRSTVENRVRSERRRSDSRRDKDEFVSKRDGRRSRGGDGEERMDVRRRSNEQDGGDKERRRSSKRARSHDQGRDGDRNDGRQQERQRYRQKDARQEEAEMEEQEERGSRRVPEQGDETGGRQESADESLNRPGRPMSDEVQRKQRTEGEERRWKREVDALFFSDKVSNLNPTIT